MGGRDGGGMGLPPLALHGAQARGRDGCAAAHSQCGRAGGHGGESRADCKRRRTGAAPLHLLGRVDASAHVPATACAAAGWLARLARYSHASRHVGTQVSGVFTVWGRDRKGHVACPVMWSFCWQFIYFVLHARVDPSFAVSHVKLF